MKTTQKRDLCILGFSGIAKSIIDTVLQQKLYPKDNIIIVDKDHSNLNGESYRGVNVFSEEKIEQKSDFICAFYKPYDIFSRSSYIETFIQKHSLEPISIIDEFAHISDTSEINSGTYIGPGVIVDSDAKIGEHNIILFNSVISRECFLDNNNFISANVTLKGSITVDKDNFISSNCVITKDLGRYNFINSSVLITTSGHSRKIIGNKANSSIMDLPEENSRAEKKLRFLNP